MSLRRRAGASAPLASRKRSRHKARRAVALATEEAIRRSVFGSPTNFVDGDMFYGQDRLELVERALVKPFAGCWQPPV